MILLSVVRWIDRRRGLPSCRGCGCTEHAACPGGCGWIEDDLCSSCWEAQVDADPGAIERAWL